MVGVAKAVDSLEVAESSWSCPEQRKAGQGGKIHFQGWGGRGQVSIPPEGGYLEADGSGSQAGIDEAEAEAEADLSLALHTVRRPQLT